jgi:geranylgeranyl reductase family protein
MWDLVVVGAGPAGVAAALGALSVEPRMTVTLLDRSDFPRDKSCGDGIAPHVLDALAEVGLHGLLDDWAPVHELELAHGENRVRRTMRRPTWVVPRAVFDARLVAAAVDSGVELQRHRVRTVEPHEGSVVLDGDIRAKLVIGADGAYSAVRRSLSMAPAQQHALAIRGYAPTPPALRGLQTMVFGEKRQPAYAWSFDRGDGYANVGYGEMLGPSRDRPSRRLLLEQLELLLPGSTRNGRQWRAHHLPLSSWRWDQPDGRILLAGDAAGLINPMTGEGIYYAVETGIRAGRAAASALAQGCIDRAGSRYRNDVRALLGRHLRHTAATAMLQRVPGLIPAGVRAAALDQHVFDDLVEVGLGRGTLTRRVTVKVIAAGMAQSTQSRVSHPRSTSPPRPL